MMAPDQLVFMVPITAIVLGIGTGIVKTVLSSHERQLEMRLRLKQDTSDIPNQQLDALRAEVAALRDTCTHFDMSIEATLQRLDQRVQHLESKSVIQTKVTPNPEPQQINIGG
jgi:sensor domain CHASE-containing protein